MATDTIVNVIPVESEEEADTYEVPEGYVGIKAPMRGNYTPFEAQLAGKLLGLMLEATIEADPGVTFSPLNTVSCLAEMVFQVETYLRETDGEGGPDAATDE